MTAKLKILPSELVKKATATELAFAEYWIRKVGLDETEKMWYLLNRALGTLWEKSDFEAPKERSYKEKKLEKVWYPLSLLLAQTDLKKIIKKDFVQSGQQIGGGEYAPSETDEVVNLSTTTNKEQFLDFLTKFGAGLPGLSNVAEDVKSGK